MTQAFSYIRFSSAEQASGDSLRRQSELTEAYAKENGLQLSDLTFRDLGISAFSGDNRTEGALSAFIKACQTGKVPRASILLVESLDRLSRQQIRKALRLLLELIDDYGVEIHTLADNRRYGRGTDMAEIMYSVMVLSRANEESERKSQRVGAAWRNKKAKASEQLGVAITSKVPAWIRAEKGKQMQLIESRAKTVADIFRMSISGMGTQLIVQWLNEHAEPFTDNAWGKSYVEKILRSPATYGAYIPHKCIAKNRRVADGELIRGYFPAAIDEATFKKAQQSRMTRYCERRGSTDKSINNLFAGLVTDKTYDIPMVYYWKGEQLISDSYKLRIKPHRVSYPMFERSFLRFLDELDWTEILDVTESTELLIAEEEIGKLSLNVESGEQTIQKLTDLLLDTPSKALKDRLIAAETQLESNKSSKVAAEARLETLRRKHRDLLDQSVIYSRLVEARDIETRAKLREEIRKKVARIEVNFDRPEDMPDETDYQFAGTVHFVNGVRRIFVCMRGRIFTFKRRV